MKRASTLQTKLFSILFLIVLISGTLSTVQAQNKGSLADLRFIEGHWKANNDDRTIEGTWLAPEGDNLVGFMRMMKGDKASMYEILAYEQTNEGLVSLVKHFKPGLIGMEEKDKYDRYDFLEATQGRAIFEKHGGEPLRILYEKRSANQFAIARGNLQDGKWIYKDLFVFNRVK